MSRAPDICAILGAARFVAKIGEHGMGEFPDDFDKKSEV
jgi:hypothetical protein